MKTAKNRCQACGEMDCKNKGGWNYRVLRHTEADGSYYFAIHEVYYTDCKETSWTEKPVSAGGDTWNECNGAYHLMFEAFTKDVLIVNSDETLTPISRFKSNNK